MATTSGWIEYVAAAAAVGLTPPSGASRHATSQPAPLGTPSASYRAMASAIPHQPSDKVVPGPAGTGGERKPVVVVHACNPLGRETTPSGVNHLGAPAPEGNVEYRQHHVNAELGEVRRVAGDCGADRRRNGDRI